MDRIDRLEAIEAIRILKARYFRCMDTKRFDELHEVFADDFKVISPSGEVWIEGGAAFAESLRNSLQHSVSCHQGFSPEIEVIDRDNATAIWPMQDIIVWQDRHPREGWKAITGRGHYHDTYRKVGGRWRIATLSLHRLRLDIEE